MHPTYCDAFYGTAYSPFDLFQNRRAASAYDSDDSESDWDTTVADSPSKHEPAKAMARAAAPTVENNKEIDPTYATVVAKPRVSLRG